MKKEELENRLKKIENAQKTLSNELQVQRPSGLLESFKSRELELNSWQDNLKTWQQTLSERENALLSALRALEVPQSALNALERAYKANSAGLSEMKSIDERLKSIEERLSALEEETGGDVSDEDLDEASGGLLQRLKDLEEWAETQGYDPED